jgi:hypothetical protein
VCAAGCWTGPHCEKTDFVVAVRSEEKRRLSREEVFVLKKKSCFEIRFLSADFYLLQTRTRKSAF